MQSIIRQPPKQENLFRNVKRSLLSFWRVSPSNFTAYLMLIFVQVAASMASVWFGGQVINNLIGIATSGAAGVAALTFNATGFIIADIASALSWTLMNYVERYSYSIMSSNCYLEYNRQQASLDLQQLDDEAVRQKNEPARPRGLRLETVQLHL